MNDRERDERERPQTQTELRELFEVWRKRLLDQGVHPDLVTSMARQKVEARPFA